MQSLEELIQEKYELYIEIQKLKRKLKIRENALSYVKNEIDEILQKETDEEEELNCIHNRKAFCDI